jgi:hypothetical protein
MILCSLLVRLHGFKYAESLSYRLIDVKSKHTGNMLSQSSLNTGNERRASDCVNIH